MTLATSPAGTDTWYLVNPTSGANNVVINFSQAISPMGSAVSYAGTDTSNPLGAIAINHGGNGTPTPSVNLTTINDNSIIDDTLYYDFSQLPLTANTPQLTQATVQCSGNESHGASTLQTTGHGSYTPGWAHSGSDSDWYEVAIEVNGVLNRIPPSVESGTYAPVNFSSCTNVSSISFSKSVSATSSLLTVHIVPGGYATSVTYAGVAMALATTTAGTETWYPINPTYGTHNVVINFSQAIGPMGSAVSYTNTDSVNPLGAIAKNNGGSGNTSVSITTNNDKSLIDDTLYYDLGQSVTANSPQVQQTTTQCSSGPNEAHGASTLPTTTHGSNTLGWSHGGTSSDWWEVAIELVGATSTRTSNEPASPSAESGSYGPVNFASCTNVSSISFSKTVSSSASIAYSAYGTWRLCNRRDLCRQCYDPWHVNRGHRNLVPRQSDKRD
jgi:hypothetical protein